MFEKEIRGESAKDGGQPAASTPQAAPAEPSPMFASLAQSITPSTSPEEAARISGALPKNQQAAALEWLGKHAGGMYAAVVADHLEGTDKVMGQVRSLGTSVSQAQQVAGQQAAAKAPAPAMTSPSPAMPSPAAPAPDVKESLTKFQDPLLGEFELLFDIDKGVQTTVGGGKIVVRSGPGLTLKCPKPFPSFTVYSVTLDLGSGTVDIQSAPSIGPFEERIMGDLLKHSLLKGAKLGSNRGMAEKLGLTADATGNIMLYKSTWVDVTMKDSCAISTSVDGDALQIGFSDPLYVDVLGPDYFYVKALKYSFANASVDMVHDKDQGWWAKANGAIYGSLVEYFGNDFIRKRLPEAMKVPGYSPARDPDLQGNFQRLMSHFSGGGGKVPEAPKGKTVGGQETGAGGQGEATRQTGGQTQSGGGAPKPEGTVEKSGFKPLGADNYQPLYEMEVKGQKVHLATDKGQSVYLSRTPTEIKLGATGGLFLVTPGADWAREVRMHEIRYALADGRVEIAASQEVGDFIKESLAAVMKVYVLPKIPAPAQQVLGIGEKQDKAAKPGQLRTLYEVDVKGLGVVKVSADVADTVQVSKDAKQLRFTSDKGIHVQPVGANWIPELVLGGITYGLEDGRIQIDPPKEGKHLDIGPVVEKVAEAIVRTKVAPAVSGKVEQALGLGEGAKQGGDPMPKKKGAVLYEQSVAGIGNLDISMASGDRVVATRAPEGGVSLEVGGGVLVRMPDVGFSALLTGMRFDPRSGRFHAKSVPAMGSYEEALVSGILGQFVMPKLREHLGKYDKSPGDGQITLYTVPVDGLGTVEIVGDEADAVRLERGADMVQITSQAGLKARVKGAEWIPELNIGRLTYQIKTGALEIAPPGGSASLDIGPLTERVATALIRTYLLPGVPKQAKGALGLQDPKAGQIEKPGQVIYEKDLGGKMGKLDVSLTDGDTIGFKHSPKGIEVYVRNGLLVRMTGLGVSARLFDMMFDPKTNTFKTRGEPPLGSYEEGLLAGAMTEFVMPKLQAFLAEHDEDLTDTTTVLYKSELAGKGTVKICVEAGDAIQLERNATEYVLSSSRGIFWLTDGEAKDLLPANRIRRVAMSLKDGKIKVDADQDFGALSEHVATQLVQTMVLPQLDPKLREKLFGGKDPKQPQVEMQPPGKLLYAGKAGEMEFDVSALGAADLAVSSRPNGDMCIFGGSDGILLRVPKAGIAILMREISFDPATMDLREVLTTPAAGPAEVGLLQGALKHFAPPILAQYFGNKPAQPSAKGAKGKAQDAMRTVVQMGDTAAKLASGDTLTFKRTNTHFVLGAERGILLESASLGVGAVPRIQSISYELGTGRIVIDLVNTQDTSVYREQREVSDTTQDVLSNLVRKLLDPYLTPELRGLGLAGQESTEAHNGGGAAPYGPPWLDTTINNVGRVQLFTSLGEQLSVTSTDKELVVQASKGIRLSIPDLKVSETFKLFRYHYETEDVELQGLGRLENALLRTTMRKLVAPLAGMAGDQRADARGPVAQKLDNYKPDRKGEREVDLDKATIQFPKDPKAILTLGGSFIAFRFEPKIFIDGPGGALGNFYFTSVRWNFGAPEVDIDLEGSNIFSLESLARRKAKEAIAEQIKQRAPEAMRRPGYDLFNDPNREQTLKELFAAFGSKPEEKAPPPKKKK